MGNFSGSETQVAMNTDWYLVLLVLAFRKSLWNSISQGTKLDRYSIEYGDPYSHEYITPASLSENKDQSFRIAFFSHFCGAGQSRANNRKRWHNINLPSGGCYFWWRPGRLCSAALDTLTLTTMKHVRIGHHPAVMPCCFLYLIRPFVTCFSFTSLLGTVLRVTISCSNSITSLIIWLETKSCCILPLAYGTKYDMT